MEGCWRLADLLAVATELWTPLAGQGISSSRRSIRSWLLPFIRGSQVSRVITDQMEGV